MRTEKAEGFERGNRGEFHQFLSIAKASCAEVCSQLYISLDIEYLEADQFGQLLMQAEKLAESSVVSVFL